MATEKKKKTGTKTLGVKTTRSKGKNTANAKKQAKMQDARMNAILIAVGFIVVGVFLFAAVQLKAAGQFGNLIGDFFKGTMGFIGILFPLYLILFGVLMLLNKSERFSKIGFFLGLLFLVILCVLNSGRFFGTGTISFNAKNLYEAGIRLENGGLFGMLIAGLLIKYIGKIGMYVITLGILLAICFILFRNTPIKTIFNAIRIRIQEFRLKHDERLVEREARKAEEEEQKRRLEANREKLEANKEERLKRREEAKNKADAFEGMSLFPEGHKAVDDTSKLDHTYTANRTPSFISIMGDDITPGKTSLDHNLVYNSDEMGLEPRRVQKHGHGMDDTVELSEEDKVVLQAAIMEKESSTQKQQRAEKAAEAETNSIKTQPAAPKDEKTVESKTPSSAKPHEEKMTRKEAENAILSEKDFNKRKKNLKYKKPPIELLNLIENTTDTGRISAELQQKADLLERTLNSFNVGAKVVHVTQGPAVTRYEIQPDVGVKVSKIKNLQDDIALNLGAKSIRIEAPIPGKSVVGIEIENDSVNMVSIRELIGSREFKQASSKISFCVGRDISGDTIVADLKAMPHLLIAGSTGSGKSVCINGILTSILYKADPDEVKLILIDPKVVELGDYNGIPHLLIPVVTDPAKAAAALNWAVAEMTDRYKKFAEAQVRNLAGYNEYVEAQLKKQKDAKEDYDSRSDAIAVDKLEKLPQIVIVIDELADLMMAAPSQVEDSICRIAQLARAAGMHLIVATQRPSTDVITGVIKANIPSRIAFAVASQYDSRTILDIGGAEKLVGKGDMLYSPVVMNHPIRVQGCFIDDDEIHRVINYVKNQADAEYSDEVMDTINSGSVGGGSGNDVDELYEDAVRFVIEAGKASTSLIQRRFRIGYNRAANIIDEMELRGIIGPADGSKPRQILVTSLPTVNEEPIEVEPEVDIISENEIEPEPVEDEEGVEPIKSTVNAQQYSYTESVEEEDINQDISDLWDDLDQM